MADQKFYAQSLAWGRTPDGRFFVNLDMQVTAAGDKLVRIPVTTFILTKDEEAQLLASLRGLHIVSGPIPASNGGGLVKGG